MTGNERQPGSYWRATAQLAFVCAAHVRSRTSEVNGRAGANFRVAAMPASGETAVRRAEKEGWTRVPCLARSRAAIADKARDRSRALRRSQGKDEAALCRAFEKIFAYVSRNPYF